MQVSPELGPLALAYVGDAVYSLFVREHVVRRGPAKGRHLHQATVCEVRAAAQARSLASLEDQLTEQERSIVRWARNAKASRGRGSTVAQRHQATAFEALLGYLHLTGQNQRLQALLTKVVNQVCGTGEDERERHLA